MQDALLQSYLLQYKHIAECTFDQTNKPTNPKIKLNQNKCDIAHTMLPLGEDKRENESDVIVVSHVI